MSKPGDIVTWLRGQADGHRKVFAKTNGGQAAPIFDAWADEVERLRAVAEAARKAVVITREGTNSEADIAIMALDNALDALDEEAHHG